MYTVYMIIVTTYKAKTHLSKLLKEVQRGEEVLIKRGDVPVAKIIAVGHEQQVSRPPVGKRTSERIKLSADAFAPLSDGELAGWGI